MDIILQPLPITQDDINREHEHIKRKYSKWFLQLVKRMEKQGYYFESMNVKGVYRFNYSGATFPLEFPTQKAIYEYVKEITVKQYYIIQELAQLFNSLEIKEV